MSGRRRIPPRIPIDGFSNEVGKFNEGKRYAVKNDREKNNVKKLK